MTAAASASERTDTERLDWLQRHCAASIIDGAMVWPSVRVGDEHRTLRRAIDAEMAKERTP